MKHFLFFAWFYCISNFKQSIYSITITLFLLTKKLYAFLLFLYDTKMQILALFNMILFTSSLQNDIISEFNNPISY